MKRIKAFFEALKAKRELRKTYKNALIICAVNGANIITNVNSIVEKVAKYADSADSLSKNDVETMISFMEQMKSADFRESVINAVIDKQNA